MGAFISNWAALNTYQANNITGQWKRATVAAAVSAYNGLGGIAGSYVVRSTKLCGCNLSQYWISYADHLDRLGLYGSVLTCEWKTRRSRQGHRGCRWLPLYILRVLSGREHGQGLHYWIGWNLRISSMMLGKGGYKNSRRFGIMTMNCSQNIRCCATIEKGYLCGLQANALLCPIV